MSHIPARLVRAALSFPGPNLLGSFNATSIPGPFDPSVDGTFGNQGGNAAFASVDNVAGVTGALQEFASNSSLNRSVQKLALPRRNGHPPSWVGIAADSAIHSCDLWMGGRKDDGSRHRIAPGLPLIGLDDDDSFALVSIPVGLPFFAPSGTDNAGHDVQRGGGTTLFGGWPLRLELGYGCLPPRETRVRAPYVAHFVASMAAASSRFLWVCCDGRRRVDITLYSSNVTTTLAAVEDCSTRKDTTTPNANVDIITPVGLPVDDAGNLTAVLTSGTPQTFSFYGNSMNVLRISLSQITNSAFVQCRVKAYDD